MRVLVVLCFSLFIPPSPHPTQGNLDYGLTEGDIITVFSQFGEISDVNLVRDKVRCRSGGVCSPLSSCSLLTHSAALHIVPQQETGKPKGFAFVGYEDQRSTVLAVDNFNGTTVGWERCSPPLPRSFLLTPPLPLRFTYKAAESHAACGSCARLQAARE